MQTSQPIKNVLDRLKKLIDAYDKDISYFESQKKSTVYVQIKKKQRAELELIINTISYEQKQLEETINTNEVTIAKKDLQIFKLEGCLLYYGVSPHEIEAFLSLNNYLKVKEKVKGVYDAGKRALPESWYWIIDENKERPKHEPLRFAEKPMDKKVFEKIQIPPIGPRINFKEIEDLINQAKNNKLNERN